MLTENEGIYDVTVRDGDINGKTVAYGRFVLNPNQLPLPEEIFKTLCADPKNSRLDGRKPTADGWIHAQGGGYILIAK